MVTVPRPEAEGEESEILAEQTDRVEAPVAEQYPGEQARLDAFRRACDAAYDLFKEKNREHQDSIRHTGVLGAVVALVGIAGRLKAHAIKSGDGGEKHRKQVINELKDSLVYAAIALIMLAEGNWTGD